MPACTFGICDEIGADDAVSSEGEGRGGEERGCRDMETPPRLNACMHAIYPGVHEY